jgi:hypothetical protein
MTTTPRKLLLIAVSSISVLTLHAMGGCSRAPDGPKRNTVRGQVTVEGKPVPDGRIVFSPDNKKGNSGPGAIAFIRAGEFETPPGHGVVSGPHIVDILGYDDQFDPSTDDEPNAVVQESLEVDIPEDGGTVDFEL